MVSQDESKKTANDSCLTPQEIQVHGAAAQVHQAVLPGRVSPGAASVQHLRRRRQLGSHVRPGGCCCSLWKVRHLHVCHGLLAGIC